MLQNINKWYEYYNVLKIEFGAYFDRERNKTIMCASLLTNNPFRITKINTPLIKHLFHVHVLKISKTETNISMQNSFPYHVFKDTLTE
jgi:hypothetical protein